MGKVAHSLYGLPPSVSLNTFSHFGGFLKVSARNHRSFLDDANIQQFFELSRFFFKKSAVATARLRG